MPLHLHTQHTIDLTAATGVHLKAKLGMMMSFLQFAPNSKASCFLFPQLKTFATDHVDTASMQILEQQAHGISLRYNITAHTASILLTAATSAQRHAM